MTLPAPCDTQLLASVVFHPELSATHRLVLAGRLADPDSSVSELARKLGVARTTVQRALARARDLQVCTGAAGAALVQQGCRTGAAGVQPCSTPADAPAVLARSEPQPQGRPPAPPRATPAPEPQQGQLLEDPARQVVALRKANGLAGRNVRTIARVLLEMADEGHPQAEVIDALGRCLVVSAPSCALTLNEGKGGRKRPSQAARLATPEERAEMDAWDPEEARRTIASWQ